MGTHNPSPSSSNRSISLPPATVPHPLQHRQVPIHAVISWEHVFETPALILAVSLTGLSFCAACIALSRLFSHILDNALTVWANSPPSNQVVLEAGDLRIEFGCSKTPVPMEFVEEFAASRLDAVGRGFAPVFAREWWWETGGGGRVCYAGMRVVEGGGSAVEPENASM